MKRQRTLCRLLETELSTGVPDALSLRRFVMETQKYLLQSEKDGLETLWLKEVQSSSIVLTAYGTLK